jgi:hypothetical protein
LLWFGVLYRRFQKERPVLPAVAVRGPVATDRKTAPTS